MLARVWPADLRCKRSIYDAHCTRSQNKTIGHKMCVYDVRSASSSLLFGVLDL